LLIVEAVSATLDEEMMTTNTFDTLAFFRTISSVEVAAMSSSSLKLIIMPTEKCNLRCKYCYEDFKLGKMSPDIQRAVIKLIRSAAPRLTELELDWFGGEPLLAAEIVEAVSQAVAVICNDNLVKYRFSATTNAVLLSPARIESLSQAGVKSFQITLDGDATFHDAYRITADGLGTFHEILQNLAHIRNSSRAVNVTLRLHYTPISLDNVKALIESLAELIGEDPRFTVFFHSVNNLGGAGGSQVLPWPSHGAKAAAEASLLAHAKKHGLGVSDIGAQYICYAARVNSFVIRSDGRINKCTVALESPRNQVGRLSTDGQLQIDSAAHLPWIAPLFTRDRKSQTCPSTAVHQS
jgi:uncharacterized protein